MKIKLFIFLKVILTLYILLCAALYFFQEKLIFFPEVLEQDYQHQFKMDFKEQHFKMKDGAVINGLLFKAEDSKGLIFYLHGNAGSIRSWGNVANTYTSLGYDVFLLDYRGYGKSTGKISGQDQLFNDNQSVYNQLKNAYQEKDIIILGYSIGSGMAAKLASDNKPAQLILQAPYYTLKDLVKDKMPIAPSFILKYKIETVEYLKSCKMPITLFHGTQDRVIPYDNALQLKTELKEKIDLIPLDRIGHNGMTNNPQYRKHLQKMLSAA